MNCRICNSAPDSRGYCPNCGFDEGLAYEYYPTLQQLVGLSLSGRRKNWEEKNSTQKSETIPSAKDHVSSAQSKKSVFISRILIIIIVAVYMIFCVWTRARNNSLTAKGIIISIIPAIAVLLPLNKAYMAVIQSLFDTWAGIILFVFSIFCLYMMVFGLFFIPVFESGLFDLDNLHPLITLLVFLILVIGPFIVTRKLAVAYTSDEESKQKKH